MNKHKITMLIIAFFWILLAIFASLFFIRLLTGGSCPLSLKSRFLGNTKNLSVEEYQFDVEGISELSLELIPESIDLTKSSDSFIHVRVSSLAGAESPVPRIKNHVLEIKRSKPKTRFFSFYAFKESVEVSIPESLMLKKDFIIQAFSTSGSISMSDMSASEIFAYSTSGSIRAKKVHAIKLDFKSTSGSVKVEDSSCKNASLHSTSGSIVFEGFADEADLRSTSGSVNAVFLEMPKKNSRFVSTSGSVRLSLPENEGFDFHYSTISGSVRNEFTGFRGKKTGVNRYKDGGIAFDLSSTSGSVRIERN